MLTLSIKSISLKLLGLIKIYGVNILEACSVVIFGLIISKLIVKILKKAFLKTNLDISLEKFILRLIDIFLKIIIVMSGLASLNISTTGLVAAFSAAAVAVSLALKDSLGNLAGGIMMLITQPFKTGDYIEADGVSGTVLQIDMIHTILRTPDNRRVVIPNGQLVNKSITDYSSEATRRLELKFGVSYDCDCEKAKRIILDTVTAHKLSLKEPEPFVRISEHGDSAVIITMRVWCNAPDYWTLNFDLLEQVKTKFDENGISIPYNQLDVHVIEKNK